MTSSSQSKNVRVMVQFQDTKLTKRSDKKPTMENSNTNFKRQVINSNRYSNTTTTKYLVPMYVVLLLGTLTAGVALLVLQKVVSASVVLGITVILILIGMSVCCTNMAKVREAEKKKMMDEIEMSHQVSQTQAAMIPPPDPIMMRGITSFTFHGKDECEACLFHRQCEETRIKGNPEFIPPSIRCMELARGIRKRNQPPNGHAVQSGDKWMIGKSFVWFSKCRHTVHQYAAHQKKQSTIDDLVRQKFMEHDDIQNFVDQHVNVGQPSRRRLLPQKPKSHLKHFKKISLSANDIEEMNHKKEGRHRSSENVDETETRDDFGVMLDRKIRRRRADEDDPRDYRDSNKDELAVVDVYPDPPDYNMTSSKHRRPQSKRNQLQVPGGGDVRTSQSSNASIEYIVDLSSEDSDEYDHDKDNLTVGAATRTKHNSNNNRKPDKTKNVSRQDVLESYMADDLQQNSFQTDSFTKV